VSNVRMKKEKDSKLIDGNLFIDSDAVKVYFTVLEKNV
jgi:hypothetical protein